MTSLTPPPPPGRTCTVRRVVADAPDSVAQACRVVRESITHCCAADHGNDAAVLLAWLANKTPGHLAAWMAAPGAMAWGAYWAEGAAEILVGFALVSRPATLALCYVVPAALYQGVGHALLQAAEAGARQCGAQALSLESTRTAEPFYRRNGYEPAGSVQVWAGLTAQPLRKVL